MSNPSKAPRDAVPKPGAPRDYHPDCYVQYMGEEPPEGSKLNAWQSRMADAKNLDKVTEKLTVLDIVWASPFVIPRAHTVAREAFQSAKPFYALAKHGKVTTRKRTDDARRVAQAAYAALPEEIKVPVFDRADVTFLADGGSEFTLGRFLAAYPRKGARVPKPITREEAVICWAEEVGPVLSDSDYYDAYVDDAEKTLYALYAEEEGQTRVVRANLSAGNGYPVLGKGNDDEARAKYIGLAESVRVELEAAYASDPVDGVELWLYRAFEERPWLVALMGKAKGDYITPQKLWDLKMRFYNVMGRHIALLLQQATQPFEELSQSVLEHATCRSSAGVAFNRGGAGKLVTALEEQLHRDEEAHTRMGDDSWLSQVVTLPNDSSLHTLMLALDAGNFDLTQHGDMTKEVHTRLRELLSRLDAMRAQLLCAYQRKRLVTLVHRIAAYLRHGGPSGLPLQSKVNGVIMGVAIKRVFALLNARRGTDFGYTEAEIAPLLAEVGRGLGISIKLEQYSLTPLLSGEAERHPILAALRTQHFLYLGYNFYYEDGHVGIYADMPRTMAQIRYPTLTWVDSAQDMKRMEASRLASTVLSWGIPPRMLELSFNAARAVALGLLREEVKKNGDWEDARLRWASQTSAQMGEGVTLGSLSAMIKALEQPYDQFWLGDEYVDVSPASSEEEGAFDTVLLPTQGLVVPAPASMAAPVLPSRKPTKKTAGRNPPTKVFAPALPPRPPQYRAHEHLQWARGEDRWNEDLQEQADNQAVAHMAFGSFDLPERERRAIEAEVSQFLDDQEFEPASEEIDADTRDGELELHRLYVGQYRP